MRLTKLYCLDGTQIKMWMDLSRFESGDIIEFVHGKFILKKYYKFLILEEIK